MQLWPELLCLGILHASSFDPARYLGASSAHSHPTTILQHLPPIPAHHPCKPSAPTPQIHFADPTAHLAHF
eukprot:1160827-Pelagomonas_calceolata.AAC.8